MIFSVEWLKEFIDPEMELESLVEELTMAGLEVDGLIPVANNFTGIVVGEVTSVVKHPDADKLSLCEVSDGESSFQVVCGAANVREGLKAPFAKAGSKIYSAAGEQPFKIKNAKIRGIESNGMLCSAEELGMAESSEGLLELLGEAPVGEDIRCYLNLNDTSIELDLTPNRGDCLGMIGLAREMGVLCRKDILNKKNSRVTVAINEEFPIKITAMDACPRYLGRVIRNIDLNSDSPVWMQEKLRRSGLRSIDPIVDVTNFVLMELGQPMHAFDYEQLKGGIKVRFSEPNEKLILLDGKEVELTPETLLVADTEQPVAIAGVMGGLKSSVTKQTQHVFLECAFFAPLAISGKARSYGMHTDASHRYERGVDYNLQHQAMERATELLLEIVGGEPGPITEALGTLPEARTVTLNFASIPRFLGINIEKAEVLDILLRLGFQLIHETKNELSLEVPSYRFDISIEADLIEELARIYGYNKLPQTAGLTNQSLKSLPESQLSLSRLQHQLVALGYQEIITYSFIDPDHCKLVMRNGKDNICLENPISQEMSVMRPSIIPGLLSTLSYNENRQQDRLRLFETGLVFQKEGRKITQSNMISGLIFGKRYPVNWSNNKDLNDFYDLKGDVESLLGLAGSSEPIAFLAGNHPSLHSGQCAVIKSGELELGHIGSLHPAIHREMDFNGPVFLFELYLDAIQSKLLPRAEKLSKFPEVSRDLAVVVEKSVCSDEILSAVREMAGEFLSDLRIFDVYQGDAIAQNEKSIALGLTWQHPSRTLSDEEINTIIGSCVNVLQDKFNANLRN
jgi:phenylalanyl-tRNA synthetase beta chain